MSKLDSCAVLDVWTGAAPLERILLLVLLSAYAAQLPLLPTLNSRRCTASQSCK